MKDSETVRTMAVDEMTGIQALERIAPGLPMRRDCGTFCAEAVRVIV